MTYELSDLPEHITSKIRVNPETGCWEWTAALYKKSGYSSVSWGGSSTYGHRATYSLLVGEIPEGFHIDHVCRVRHCVNPDPNHLEAVTPWVNNARSSSPSAQNITKTHCNDGHPFNEENTYWSTRKDGRKYRACRTCDANRHRARRARGAVSK